MFLDNCSVLHDEHARVSPHDGLERHGVNETEVFRVDTHLLRHLFHLVGT